LLLQTYPHRCKLSIKFWMHVKLCVEDTSCFSWLEVLCSLWRLRVRDHKSHRLNGERVRNYGEVIGKETEERKERKEKRLLFTLASSQNPALLPPTNAPLVLQVNLPSYYLHGNCPLCCSISTSRISHTSNHGTCSRYVLRCSCRPSIHQLREGPRRQLEAHSLCH
jgi:hypothetical protein